MTFQLRTPLSGLLAALALATSAQASTLQIGNFGPGGSFDATHSVSAGATDLGGGTYAFSSITVQFTYHGADALVDRIFLPLQHISGTRQIGWQLYSTINPPDSESDFLGRGLIEVGNTAWPNATVIDRSSNCSSCFNGDLLHDGETYALTIGAGFDRNAAINIDALQVNWAQNDQGGIGYTMDFGTFRRLSEGATPAWMMELSTTGGDANDVPEPGTLSLALAAGLGLALRRRRA